MSTTRRKQNEALRASALLKSFDDNLQAYLEESKPDLSGSDTSTPEDSENDEWFERESNLLEVRRQLMLAVKIPENIGLKKWEHSELERHKLFYNVKAELGPKATPDIIQELANDSFYDSSNP